MRNLIDAVSQPPQQQQRASSTPALVGDQSWPSSAPSTPTSLTAAAVKPAAASFLPAGSVNETSSLFGGLTTSFAATSTADDTVSPPTGAAVVADHAVLHGTFLDVFADPLTATSWRLYDKILYLVWWSYRPPSCANCGMQDAWMPSGDVEFKCSFCLNGAGTTRSNAIVEDIAAADKETTEYGNDSGDDDEMEEKDKAGSGGGGSGGSGGGGGPIDSYLFFYEWLQRIPLLGHVEESSGHDVGHSQPLPSASSSAAAASNVNATTMASWSSNCTRAGRPASAAATTGASSSSVMLPSGEALPAVLRAAYDMSSLLTTPGLPQGTAPVIRAAGLYISLLLHRYVSLFPLFCLAGRSSFMPTGKEDRSSAAAPAAASARNANAFDHDAAAATAAATQATDVELQWIDVELVCALLGVIAPSFFESAEVSVQHLQNVFTVVAAYGVPSVLWHPGRVPGRVEVLKTLRDKVIPLCPVHATAAGVSGLCPEHTAMVVALEFARRVDAHPIAASSTSPAAAAQNAQRVGAWLDALGLYPTRRVYRDIHSFHQVVAAQAQEGEEQARSSVKSMTAVKKEDEEEVKVNGGSGGDTTSASDCQDTTREWEKTLTELAAVNDEHLTSAAARHAHRHDTLFSASAAAAAASPLDSASASPLTTPRSPFYKRFEWILTSPCANALLHVFAAVFQLTPMELADMALRSGIYQGHASGYIATLRTVVLRGAYDAMPLARRLSPLSSPWMSAYMALHSSDRLPLLATLFQLNDGQNTTRDRQAALTRLLQKILRKHHAAQLYQFNYILRVTDEDEKHFNGTYFLSSVLWQEGLAIFTCLRSGRKTITFNRFSHTLSLCYMNAKEKIVSRLNMHVMSPVVAAVETEAARLVTEIALGTVARGVSTHGDPWGTVVRCLDKCARVRRRMRVPMLASRLDALASIRENVSSVVVRRFSQIPPSIGGSSGGGGVGMMTMMGPTLLGWGETETLLAAAPQLDVRQLRRDLQWNFLALPNASLLSGLSENRVVAMYASLVGLLELIHARLCTAATSSSPPAASAALVSNWVEELLFVEDEEEEEENEVQDVMPHDFGGAFAVPAANGSGWSPPMYRNSRGGTPKRSRSPKSKFVSVSTATNAPMSAFTANYAGSNSSSRYAPTPPQSFTRQPYMMTPPSMVPSSSPVLRSTQVAGAAAAAAAPSAWSAPPFSSHNAVSTPIHRFQTPPSTSLAAVPGNDSRSSPSHTPPLTSAVSGMLPDLELSASTADVEKRLSAGSKTATAPQERSRRRAGRHRRPRDHDDDDHDDNEDEDAQWKSKDEAAGQQVQVLALLRQALPPYWEVLLGLATDLALPASASAAGSPGPGTRGGVRRDVVDDDDDEGENGGGMEGGVGGVNGDDARRTAARARERRLRKQPPHSSQNAGGSRNEWRGRPTTRQSEKDSNATTAAATLRSEASISHHPFNLFDAEECRRRLHRLYVFIGAYIACKQRCEAQAAAGGALPIFADKPPTSPPPPPLPVMTAMTGPGRPAAATTGSPPTPIRAGGGGAHNNSSGLRTPPQVHFTPPPPYPATAASTTADTRSSSGGGPPRSSPALAAQRLLSPCRQQSQQPHATPSPLHSPEPRTSSNNALSNSSVGAPRQPRHGSHGGGSNGGISPVPLSPPLPTAERRRAGESGGGGGGGSGSPKQQRPSTSPLLRTSPHQQSHSKRASGIIKGTSTAANTADSNVGAHAETRGRVERERTATAVALADDEDFALPPSEVSWSDDQQRQRASRAVVVHRRRDTGKEKLGWRRSPDSPLASPRESRRTRPQQRRRAARTPSSSTTSSDTENEEEHLDVPVPFRTSQRKRARDAATKTDDERSSSSSNSSSDDNEDNDDDGKDEHGNEEAEQQQQQQLLRRKTKKLGRRRRRQEQNMQHQQYQQQQQQQLNSMTSPPRSSNNKSGSVSNEPSRSPEIRAWRNGRISGSVSPLGNSPALPPRSNNADAAAALKKTRVE